MRLKNSSTGFGLIAISIHWVFALTIFGLFGLGLYMVELTYYDSLYRILPDWHRSIGILLGLLLVFRLVWRLLNPQPAAEGNNSLEHTAAKAAHVLLYLLPAGLVISGYLITTADGSAVSVFGWFEVPALLEPQTGREDVAGDIHAFLAWSLIALAVLHAAAALKHHFIDRDSTLKRMLRPAR